VVTLEFAMWDHFERQDGMPDVELEWFGVDPLALTERRVSTAA
jgi:hypothetical protein